MVVKTLMSMLQIKLCIVYFFNLAVQLTMFLVKKEKKTISCSHFGTPEFLLGFPPLPFEFEWDTKRNKNFLQLKGGPGINVVRDADPQDIHSKLSGVSSFLTHGLIFKNLNTEAILYFTCFSIFMGNTYA